MSLPTINIELGQGGLGLTIPTNDGRAGLIFQGPAPAGLTLGTPRLVTSLAAAEALGITAAYDTAQSVQAHRQIKAFFAEAGTGAELWIMGVAQAVTLADIVDKDEAYATVLLDAAAGGIRLLTVVRDPASGYTPTVTNGIDADVETAIGKAQALAVERSEAYAPLRVILPAYAYNGTVADLANLKARTDNRVAVLLGNDVTGARCGVGILLGRLASVPVQRNPGRVKDGALPITTAFIGAETVEVAADDIAGIHAKGYITFRRHVGKAGYFFTDDPTATASTDDYSSLARGRVIDKAIFLAYTVYLEDLLDEIRIDPDTGRISSAQAKYFQTIADTAISAVMTANDEISGVQVEVDPAQNVLSTGKICVKLRLIPVAYAKTIEIELGFFNPALNN